MRLRVVAVLFALVGLVVAGAAGGVLWLIATEGGARFVVDRLVAATGGVLTADEVSGTLGSRVELSGLRLSIDHVEASAASATAELDLRQLLRRRVVVRDLYVTPLTVVPREPERPPGAADEPFEAVELPVDIVLESIAIAGVVLEVGESSFEFGQLTLAVGYAGRVIDVTRFESRYQDFAFSTQARLDLAGEPSIDATASIAGRYAGLDVLIGAEASGTLPALNVEAELLEPTPVTASGPVILNAGPGVALTLEWPAVDQAVLAAFGIDGIAVGAGTGRVSGVPDAIAVAAVVPVTVGADRIDVTADTRYTPGSLDVVSAELRRDGGVVALSGALALDSSEFGLRIDGSGIDPAWYVPGWDGSVELGATVAGALGQGWSAATDDLTATGVVRGQPFTATGAGRYSADGAGRIERSEVVVGGNVVTATGLVGAALALDLEADLADLAALADGLGGELSAALAVTGSPTDPAVSGEISGRGLSFGTARVESLTVTGTGGVAADSMVDLDIRAGTMTIGGAAADSLVATFAGTAATHVADVALSGRGWRADSQLSGAVADGPAWNGRLETLRYAQPPFGEWMLAAPADVTLSRERIELADGCLTRDSAELCLGALIAGDQPGRLRVVATDFDLELLRAVLPETITASGRYEADIDITGTRTSFVGRFRVAGGPTRIGYVRTPDDAVTVELERVTADATVEPDRFDSTAEIVGGGEDRVALRLSGTRGADDVIVLDGLADASWADLAPLTILSRNVGAVGGRLAAAIEIGGTFDAPQMDGRAEITDGTVELPVWGVTAESISGVAASANGEAVHFDFTGQVDGSALRLTGTTELNAPAGWPTRLNLAGDRVHLVQVADADIYVSPDLDVDVDLPRVRVAGTVTVPEALISIAELPAQAVRPSSDTVIHGDAEPERVSPLLLDADIDLVLGDDVRYEGSGLFADLDGSLRLRYSTQTSTDAAGTLSVSGRYEAFGQELTLERGELIFTGAMQNPALDMRAVRRVEEIRVGIDLTGTLQSPVTRIFSEPAMAEADAVSYLLFGRPLAVPDGAGDPDQLRNAAVSLGLRQAVPVIQRIGDTLGLDEFAIESTELDAGELMAGKFLSPKLYVRYSYGLFNRIGGLLLQYRLNDRISIETRSGDQKSMDVLYTIEKD